MAEEAEPALRWASRRPGPPTALAVQQLKPLRVGARAGLRRVWPPLQEGHAQPPLSLLLDSSWRRFTFQLGENTCVASRGPGCAGLGEQVCLWRG